MKLDGDVVREPIVEHVPPEITAARWFLLNRRPDKWNLRPEARVKLPVTIDGSAKSLTEVLVTTLNAIVSGESARKAAGSRPWSTSPARV